MGLTWASRLQASRPQASLRLPFFFWSRWSITRMTSLVLQVTAKGDQSWAEATVRVKRVWWSIEGGRQSRMKRKGRVKERKGSRTYFPWERQQGGSSVNRRLIGEDATKFRCASIICSERKWLSASLGNAKMHWTWPTDLPKFDAVAPRAEMASSSRVWLAVFVFAVHESRSLCLDFQNWIVIIYAQSNAWFNTAFRSWTLWTLARERSLIVELSAGTSFTHWSPWTQTSSR